MATMTISLPEPMKQWIETRIKDGQYASASDYLRDLVRRDREKAGQPELTLDDLRRIVAEARAGGDSDRSVMALFEAASRKHREG